MKIYDEKKQFQRGCLEDYLNVDQKRPLHVGCDAVLSDRDAVTIGCPDVGLRVYARTMADRTIIRGEGPFWYTRCSYIPYMLDMVWTFTHAQ